MHGSSLAASGAGDRFTRIGVLMGYAETDSEAKALQREFTHTLSEFGWIEADGHLIFFNFDNALAYHSPDPSVTEHIVTVMLAEEY